MTERGIVTEIREKLVTVQLEMTEGCGVCGNEGCKTGRRSIQGYNKRDLKVSEGDMVELEVSGKAQMSGALWVLGLPLALFVGGYALGRFLFPGLAEGPAAEGPAAEGPAALCGLVGFALGMLVGVMVQKGKRMESFPQLLRKVEMEIGLEPAPDYDENSTNLA
jgi:positive regulator of sigma E activity